MNRFLGAGLELQRSRYGVLHQRALGRADRFPPVNGALVNAEPRAENALAFGGSLARFADVISGKHGRTMQNASSHVNAFCIVTSCRTHRMTDPSERLRWAREKAGYDTPTDAARALGMKEPTYLAHENGSRGFKAKAERYSRAFRVNLDWLVTGRGVPKNSAHEAPEAGRAVPVLGYVGAGAEVHPIDDHAMGAGLETVEVDFPIRPGTVAVIVRGDSMLPIFEDGDLIGYMEDSADPMTLIGKTCVVRLTDGRTFIKKLRKGSDDGLFTLVSANARDIEDVEIEWARRYRFHIPADEWRALAR